MEPFKVGDTVRLKSGGPVMTVGALIENGRWFGGSGVACGWFSGTTFMQDQFPTAAVEAATP
jgi:uncharacterized protein YodC (DUF2158 family)